MNKKQIVSGLACFFSLSVSSQEQPNIILILIDDMGWNDIGCYGSKFYQTPNIDKLASEGVMFTDAYSACTVSSPSRAAILTGKYPARLHLTDWLLGYNYPYAKLSSPEWTQYLPLEEKTVAEHLKEKGYSTWHIGKWHLGEDPKYYPQHQGFDVNIGGNFKGSPNRNKKDDCGGYFSPYCLQEITDGPKGEYLTDRLTDEAVNLIAEQNTEKPFFLNLWHYAVHTPLDAIAEEEDYFKSLVDSSYFQTNAKYAAMVYSVDRSVGKIIEVLKKKGLDNNTLIIFTSDNGALYHISRNYPLREGKGSSYEGGVRVPFIISWGDHVAKGKKSQVPISGVDIFSTILTASQIKPTELVDGKNILPFCMKKENKKAKDHPVFFHYPHYHPGGAKPYSAVRIGDWKLIENYENNTYELYNLRIDVGEKNNLATQKTEKRDELKKVLEKLKKESKAQLPLQNPNWDINKEKQTGQYRGK